MPYDFAREIHEARLDATWAYDDRPSPDEYADLDPSHPDHRPVNRTDVPVDPADFLPAGYVPGQDDDLPF